MKNFHLHIWDTYSWLLGCSRAWKPETFGTIILADIFRRKRTHEESQDFSVVNRGMQHCLLELFWGQIINVAKMKGDRSASSAEMVVTTRHATELSSSINESQLNAFLERFVFLESDVEWLETSNDGHWRDLAPAPFHRIEEQTICIYSCNIRKWSKFCKTGAL